MDGNRVEQRARKWVGERLKKPEIQIEPRKSGVAVQPKYLRQTPKLVKKNSVMNVPHKRKTATGRKERANVWYLGNVGVS